MPAEIKCLLAFGTAKLALTVEQWGRMMLQGWLELSEVAVEEDRAASLSILKEKLI